MVGLPRESKISRPIISTMLVCILRGYDARCARAVQQMLRNIFVGGQAADLEHGPAAGAPSGFPNPLTQASRASVTSAGSSSAGRTDWKVCVPGKRFALAIST